MTKISDDIIFQRIIGPVLGCAFFFFIFYLQIQADMSWLLPIFIPVFLWNFYFYKKTFHKSFVQEVYDCDKYLLLIHNNMEEKVYFNQIQDLKYVRREGNVVPARIIIKLIEACSFGKEITFAPDYSFSDWREYKKNMVFEILKLRLADSKK
jgi:hypothetical protein